MSWRFSLYLGVIQAVLAQKPTGSCIHNLGSTGSDSSASTPNTHSCTRRSGSRATNRSSASRPSANSRNASARLPPSDRFRSRARRLRRGNPCAFPDPPPMRLQPVGNSPAPRGPGSMFGPGDAPPRQRRRKDLTDGDRQKRRRGVGPVVDVLIQQAAARPGFAPHQFDRIHIHQQTGGATRFARFGYRKCGPRQNSGCSVASGRDACAAETREAV